MKKIPDFLDQVKTIWVSIFFKYDSRHLDCKRERKQRIINFSDSKKKKEMTTLKNSKNKFLTIFLLKDFRTLKIFQLEIKSKKKRKNRTFFYRESFLKNFHKNAAQIKTKTNKKRKIFISFVEEKFLQEKFYYHEKDFRIGINFHYNIFNQESLKTIFETLRLENSNKINWEFLESNRNGIFYEIFINFEKENQGLNWMKDYQKICHPFLTGLNKFEFFIKPFENLLSFHKNFKIFSLFRVLNGVKEKLLFLEKKNSNFHVFFSSSPLSEKLEKELIMETKEIFSLRGFLNRLISDQSEPPISSKKSDLRCFKYLTLEIVEKIQKDFQFIKTYTKVLINYCKKIRNKDTFHLFFLRTIIKKKSTEKLEIFKNAEYNFQSENRFVFLKYSKIKFNEQSWIFWNKYLENFFGLDSCFDIFYNFGGFCNSPYLPLKTIFFFTKKHFSCLREVEIDLFRKVLEFFLRKQVEFTKRFFKSSFEGIVKRIKDNTKNSRILFILTKVQMGLNQKKDF